MIWRIHDHATFADLRRRGRRVRRGPVSVTWAPPRGEDAAGPPRVAYAIGRTAGNAVVRNRLRRRLRAIMAEEARAGRLAGGAWLVGAGPAAVDMTYESLKASVAEALSALSNEPAR